MSNKELEILQKDTPLHFPGGLIQIEGENDSSSDNEINELDSDSDEELYDRLKISSNSPKALIDKNLPTAPQLKAPIPLPPPDLNEKKKYNLRSRAKRMQQTLKKRVRFNN